jgi:ATP-dependent DNA helicase DinG
MPGASYMVRPSARKEKEEGSDSSDRQLSLPTTVRHATDFFPAKEYRPGQREAIEQIEDAFVNKHHRFVVAELSTGTGKSHIAYTFAKYFRDAHILTVQKILQRQYEDTFRDIFSMQGRGSYTCLRESSLSCAKGPCRRTKNITDSDCPYKVASYQAHASKITVHNFDGFYYQNKGRPYDKREILICDEAHSLEQKYLGFMSFTLSNKSRRDWVLPDFKLAKQYKDFCEEEKKNLDVKIQHLEDQDCLLAEEIVALEDMQELSLKLSIFISKVESMEYVVDYVDNKEWQTVTFRPLFVGSFIQDTLFPKGEKILLLSATILSKKHFCDSIGVNSEEVAFIQMGSCFPIKNRPIVKRYAGSMSYKEIDKTLPKSIEIVNQILAKFPNKRGIIQTHSEKIASYIKNNISDPRLTFRRDFTTVEGMLEEHRIKENSFIVASGLREGLDLREDMSRVQIIMKVPYLDLGDSRTKRRKEIDPSWYGLQTALLFVQTIGRSVRSEQDKAITYILDSSFDMFLNINKKFIPDYISEAIL